MVQSPNIGIKKERFPLGKRSSHFNKRLVSFPPGRPKEMKLGVGLSLKYTEPIGEGL